MAFALTVTTEQGVSRDSDHRAGNSRRERAIRWLIALMVLCVSGGHKGLQPRMVPCGNFGREEGRTCNRASPRREDFMLYARSIFAIVLIAALWATGAPAQI